MSKTKTLGILGGGQLGRMLASAAAKLGIRTIILCPDENCPARDVAYSTIVAAYDDMNALKKLHEACDAITYEFENVPAKTISHLVNLGARVAPNARALEKAQDRLFEKQFVNEIGAKTAPFFPVDNADDLAAGLKEIGLPAILKTRRLGYDGKGQTRITEEDADVHGTYEKAVDYAWQEVGAAPSILEGMVPFVCEISIIGARSFSGEIAAFDPPENYHKSGILSTSTVPAKISGKTEKLAREITTKILTELDYVGVIGVEFFVLESGDVLVNEFAPRVHNSGHWTSDVCAVSQFEQHIRAVCDWPLGDPGRFADVVMQNLIGEDINKTEEHIMTPGAALHIYGKSEIRAGRKMGHINFVSPMKPE